MCNILGLLSILSFWVHSVRGVNYIGVAGSATWAQAQSACEGGIWVFVSGGKLATWDNYAQYRDYVRHAAIHTKNLNGNPNAWVGLTDERGDGSDGYWHFIDDTGTNRQSMDEWSNGEPSDDAGNEDCALVWEAPTKLGDLNGLNDANCNNQANFICEFASISVPAVHYGRQDVDVAPMPDVGHYYYVFEMASKNDVVTLLSSIPNSK
mmetsp:Transcript_10304/g.15574  ORF Transcript_10304/g.15574 Transcript_10304/m.15574 type:complete len:208 (+) Transcript_10304:98-721(+)